MAVVALGAFDFDDNRLAHVPEDQIPTTTQSPSPRCSAPRPRLYPLPVLSSAHCEASRTGTGTASAAEDVNTSSGYAEWLAARGVIGLENIRLSKDGIISLSDAGHQLFSSRWKRFGRRPDPAVVVAFPLTDDKVLSEATICADPSYAKYADKGYNMIIMYLIVERMKAEHGGADPWIRHIAAWHLSLPILWSFNEVDWLRGTSLYRAVMHQRDSLQQEWQHTGVRQASSELARAAGLRSPTFEDFTWATAAFTLFAVPIPAPVAQEIDENENPHGTHSLQIVPGLDMFTPGTGTATQAPAEATCHLDIDASRRQLCVVCPATNASVALTLSHGGEDASVEQMLFQFGALDVDPMNEVLMIECPVPPVQEWGTSIKRRFALLLEGDLRPQLFLSRRQLAEIRKTVGKRGLLDAPARRQRFERMFPPGVRETIEIFVMDEDQLQARIAGAEDRGTADSQETSLAEAGMRMAVLTTVVRLLEVKQYQLESSEHGTGTLEADERLLHGIDEEQRGTTAMPHSGPTARQLAALRHRMEQKRLVRDYLEIYSAALHDEMAHMKELSLEAVKLQHRTTTL